MIYLGQFKVFGVTMNACMTRMRLVKSLASPDHQIYANSENKRVQHGLAGLANTVRLPDRASLGVQRI